MLHGTWEVVAQFKRNLKVAERGHEHNIQTSRGLYSALRSNVNYVALPIRSWAKSG